MIKRVFHFFDFGRIITLLVVGIFLNLAYIAYLAYYPFKTLVINNNPVPICDIQFTDPRTCKSPKEIKAGEPITYQVDYCRYSDTPAEFTRTLQGPSLITLATASGKGLEGCHKIKVSGNVIPDYALPGKYHLQVDICVRATPLQNQCQEFRTQEFTVVREE